MTRRLHKAPEFVDRDGMRLDRDGVSHVGDVPLEDDDRRPGQGRRRVTLDDRGPAGDVTGRIEVRVVGVVRDGFVDEGPVVTAFEGKTDRGA